MNETSLLTDNFNPRNLYRLGGMAALAQFIAVLAYTVALAVLGSKPASAEEYFLIQQSSRSK
jgi:hypothetical protein